jgi:MoxR-like ATPase
VLAKLLGLQFNRIQFTSDILPADIIGASIYDRDNNSFTFHQGPVFTQLLLADEINRATPKAQSALLEAMEEHQVSIEGETRDLPEPFFVIATQNPEHHIGTFPLPESQLDRFMMRIELGYPDHIAERKILRGRNRRDLINEIKPIMEINELFNLQKLVGEINTSDPLLDYLQDILEYTRRDSRFSTGLSPRAGLALMRSAQSWALMDGRNEVLPEDIQTVIPAVVIHRLRDSTSIDSASENDLATQLIQDIPIP